METKKRVLIIEENAALQHTLVDLFRHGGYHAKGTCLLWPALSALKQNPYDLIVMDLIPIDDHSLSLFFRIRRDYPSLPIILLSSDFDFESIPGILKEKGWIMLAKPFEPRYLLRKATQMTSVPVTTLISD